MKEKEKELTSKQATEMEELIAAWNIFKLAEAGELPSSPIPTNPPNESEAVVSEETSCAYNTTTVTLSKAAKKRLARETRENLEAASAIATANTIPDFRKMESESLAKRISSIQFGAPFQMLNGGKIHEVSADGHCLFRALSHQLSLYLPHETREDDASPSIPDYVTLRRQCHDEIIANIEDYAPFLLDDEGIPLSEEKIREYAKDILNSGSKCLWGSHTEVAIISKLYNRPISIVNADFIVPVGEIAERTNSRLWVSYHQHLYASEHYNSISPKI